MVGCLPAAEKKMACLVSLISGRIRTQAIVQVPLLFARIQMVRYIGMPSNSG